MKKEIWKDILGYEGLYQVSNFGRVRSLDRIVKEKNGKNKFLKGKILKYILVYGGYMVVRLSKNGILKNYYVHRLVAQAFLDNPDNLPCVNHKDENPQNNVVSNLEWCDAKYNLNYGTRNKRISEKMTNGKLSKPVLQYTLDGELVKKWSSTHECGRNGYNRGNVSACCLGYLKFYKGYIWRYEKDQDV